MIAAALPVLRACADFPQHGDGGCRGQRTEKLCGQVVVLPAESD